MNERFRFDSEPNCNSFTPRFLSCPRRGWAGVLPIYKYRELHYRGGTVFSRGKIHFFQETAAHDEQHETWSILFFFVSPLGHPRNKLRNRLRSYSHLIRTANSW